MRRAVLVAAVTALLCAPIASAAADNTVTVHGLGFEDSPTYLTYFGCEDLFQTDNQAPQVRIGRDTGATNRSFGILVKGDRTASGPVHRTDSVAGTTTAGFSARANGLAEGAAYVWYVTDDLEAGQVWAGRADLQVGTSWTDVNFAASTYTWRLLDAATGDEVDDAGTATIAAFTKKNGDGPGYMLGGLGCDGQSFSIDRLKFGGAGAVTTYDLEGLESSAEMLGATATEVAPGTAVTIKGSAHDGTGVPAGIPMVLQARAEGEAAFEPTGGPIPADTDAVVRATVKPKVTTTYRWYLPDLGYAGDVRSGEITIVVLPPAGEPSPGGSGGESGTPSEELSSGDNAESGSAEATQPEPEPTAVPDLPDQAPPPPPSPPPAEEPTADPTPDPTPPAESTEPAGDAPAEATP